MSASTINVPDTTLTPVPVLYTSKAKVTIISGTVPHGRVGWLFEDPATGEPLAEPKALHWFAGRPSGTYPNAWVSLEEFCRMTDRCAKERAKRFLPRKRQPKSSAMLLRGEDLASSRDCPA